MKKKRFFIFGIVLLLCSIVFLSFMPQKDTYASGNIYTYDCEYLTDMSLLPDYAIESVMGYEFQNSTCLSIVLDCSKFPSPMGLFAFSANNYLNGKDNSGFALKSFIFDFGYSNLGNEFGFNSIYAYSLDNINAFSAYYGDGLDQVNFACNSGSGRICINFYTSTFYDSGAIYDHSNRDYSSDFSAFLDMDSTTNQSCMLNYDYFGRDKKMFFQIYDYFAHAQSYNLRLDLSNYTLDKVLLKSVGQSSFVDYSSYFNYIDRMSFANYFYPSFESRDFKMQYSSLYFKVNRPVYRLNNSLIVYSYDYLSSIISSTNLVDYRLTRGEDEYDVRYWSENALPNERYYIFNNKELDNIIFDTYVLVWFMDQMNVGKTYTMSAGDLRYVEGEGLYYDFCFDFNFVQYMNPLVASDGSYNYDFEKPDYVDMPFSLNPFYIPFLELVENAMIFLMFYCPIVSDIMEILYLDRFIGSLLNVINFVLGSGIGQFILSCVAFFMFFSLIKTFMPIVYNATSYVVDNSQFGYNMDMNRKEKRLDKYTKMKMKRLMKKEHDRGYDSSVRAKFSEKIKPNKNYGGIADRINKKR